jgi:ArsR family transcriptional regulator, arsenate/arsenite/antimonite-responsive transcriptional repressor
MTAPIHTIDSDIMSSMCKAMAHPTRVQIINYLKTVEKCNCNEIVGNFPLAQSTISQHLKILKESTFIKANEAGIQTFYSLNRRALKRFSDMAQMLEN